MLISSLVTHVRTCRNLQFVPSCSFPYPVILENPWLICMRGQPGRDMSVTAIPKLVTILLCYVFCWLIIERIKNDNNDDDDDDDEMIVVIIIKIIMIMMIIIVNIITIIIVIVILIMIIIKIIVKIIIIMMIIIIIMMIIIIIITITIAIIIIFITISHRPIYWKNRSSVSKCS